MAQGANLRLSLLEKLVKHCDGHQRKPEICGKGDGPGVYKLEADDLDAESVRTDLENSLQWLLPSNRSP